jgi:hypothetical protein
MRETVQRFTERYQLWLDEQRGDRPSRSDRNPLWWAAVGSFAALLPPYHFLAFVDYLPRVAALVFLGLYFAKSRLAWHVLAADILLIGPVYFLLSPAWRLQIVLHPGIVWFPLAGTVVFGALLFWSRRRYLLYVEQKKFAADESI